MTRSARRRRDRVTVDELLRQTGVQPRQVGSRSSPVERASRNAAAGVPSDRRGSAPEPRGGAGRIALASSVLVVLGGLVLALATRPSATPETTQFPQLQPATAVPTSTSALAAVPTETTTPSPVVMHARRTPTPTPTVTVELPPPATTSPAKPPSTWEPPPYYGCYPYYCGGYYSGTPVR